jgi:hypothetical protein
LRGAFKLYALQRCGPCISHQRTYDAPKHQHYRGLESDCSRQCASSVTPAIIRCTSLGYWHKTDLNRCPLSYSLMRKMDMPTALRNVCFQGQCEKHTLAWSFSVFGPISAAKDAYP